MTFRELLKKTRMCFFFILYKNKKANTNPANELTLLTLLTLLTNSRYQPTQATQPNTHTRTHTHTHTNTYIMCVCVFVCVCVYVCVCGGTDAHRSMQSLSFQIELLFSEHVSLFFLIHIYVCTEPVFSIRASALRACFSGN